MPLYLYECDECAMRFEASRSIDERKKSPCPHCDGGVGQQKITPVAFDETAMGLDPDFPTAASKWARRQEKKGEHLRTTGQPRSA